MNNSNESGSMLRKKAKRSICTQCKRPLKVCYCHTIQHVDNGWPIHILQHPAESKHAIGTARIASLSLNQCQLQIGENFDDNALTSMIWQDANTEMPEPLLVYPGEHSQDLAELDPLQPQPLIFIDASWRKSRRMLLESPALMKLPKVSFQPETVSRYRIRKEPDQYALSTLESIVYALSILEGSAELYRPLLDSMDWMIEKQIELMGKDVFEKNYKHYRK
jgi:DTW domain-containing protein YfiP